MLHRQTRCWQSLGFESKEKGEIIVGSLSPWLVYILKKKKKKDSFKNQRIVPCGGKLAKLSALTVNELVCQMEREKTIVTMLSFVWDFKIRLTGNAANTEQHCFIF